MLYMTKPEVLKDKRNIIHLMPSEVREPLEAFKRSLRLHV